MQKKKEPDIKTFGIETATNKEELYKAYETKLERLLSYQNVVGLDDKEIKCRKNKLHNAIGSSIANMFSDTIYSYAHEIRSIEFFANTGSVIISQDSRSVAGPDITYNNKYYIEFASCTYGKDDYKTQLARIGASVTNDMGIQLINSQFDKQIGIMALRFSSIIREKLDQYNRNILKLEKSNPYIVFINEGRLSGDFRGLDDFAIKQVLYGQGELCLAFDKEGNNRYTFTYTDKIEKTNDILVPVDLFSKEEYQVISGIILTKAGLRDEYDEENITLYLNPNAINQVDKSELPIMRDALHYEKAPYSTQVIERE